MKQVGQFASERKLDLCAIMTTSTSDEGEFQRELLLWSVKKGENDGIVKRFGESNEEDLGLEEWSEAGISEMVGDGKSQSESGLEDAGKFEIWWQKKVDMSRKQVAPLLRKAIEN